MSDGAGLVDLEPPGGADVAAWQHFDHEWYLQAYPDVLDELTDHGFAAVRRHYVEQGSLRGCSPNPYFDEAWYLRRYPEIGEAVAEGRVASGYAHYCAEPRSGRTPHWLFSETGYAAAADDLDAGQLAADGLVNFYDHYLRFGCHEGRTGHALFDAYSYRSWVAAAGEDIAAVDRLGAFPHFLQRVWWDRLDATTSVYFDPEWYLETYPEARAALDSRVFACALQAYLVAPPPSTNPSRCFDEGWYVAQHPEVRAGIANGELLCGYEHFLSLGVFALLAPAPDIDLAGYRDSRPDVLTALRAGEVRDVFEHYLRFALAPAKLPLWPSPAKLVAAPAPPPVAPVQAPMPAELRPARFELPRGRGHVEFYGYHMPSRGWVFCGWLTTAEKVLQGSAEVTIHAEFGQVAGEALMASHVRADLGEIGLGVVIHLQGAGTPLGALMSVSIAMGAARWTVTPAQGMALLRDQALGNAAMPVIASLVPGDTRQQLSALCSRRGYTGANTLSELRDRVYFEIDEAIACPPGGLALVGWALFEPGQVRSIRVQCGHLTTELAMGDCVRMDRHDVLESVGLPNGLAELRSGFIAYLPACLLPDEQAYLEFETTRGETAHRGIPKPRLRGMAAIRFLLDRVDLRYNAVGPAYDRIFGPAVAALNAERLAVAPRFETIAFGRQPESPVLTVIVSLYGRLDFVEYQFGFASRHVPGFEVEYIYVLDEPARQREAEALAASVHERFRIPLKLVCLARNLGFGPANNVGLDQARGAYVCFLNSDVFAGTPDWMERLVARLRADPGLGAVGPLLLFEDDCVQHEGMLFERLPEFAGWHFPMHGRKGWRPPEGGGLRPCLAITGACMVMRTALATQLGGFDEAYAIGDFEDSDLCLKLHRQGLTCAVDLDARLYHLERQSQAGSAQLWRMNLTLCNAWTHERRWGEMLTTIDGIHMAGA